MARGHSKGGNAHGTPSSLTTLLAPAVTALPSVLPDPNWYANEIRAFENREVIDDRRRFRPPTQVQPALSGIRGGTRLSMSVVARPAQVARQRVPTGVKFRIPNMVAICVRRKIRREVLHALDKTRFGGRGGKRRRNPYSGIQC